MIHFYYHIITYILHYSGFNVIIKHKNKNLLRLIIKLETLKCFPVLEGFKFNIMNIRSNEGHLLNSHTI